MRLVCALLALALSITSSAAAEPSVSANKTQAVESIDALNSDLVDLSEQIWGFAETALRETRSAALLADYAQAQGFTVERGVADLPTAFTATYGGGRPVIGIMGEYDALPGISQKVQTTQESYEAGAGGHGCGHNLFGPASLGAAIAIKRLIERGELQGTIRFYGCPAEESVGGKLYMVRAGLFDDVDVALAWHPSDEIRADTESSQALVDFDVIFSGRTAHAAADPWNGRSALDGLELFTFALNQMREHVRPTTRMHYVIRDGGNVPNVVPDQARLWCWLRDSTHERVDELLVRVRDIVDGAALATGTEAELRMNSGDYEMLVNMRGAHLLQSNLEWLGPIAFTEQEQDFARQIQRETGVEAVGLSAAPETLDLDPPEPQGGSTDVADVSWNVPTLHVSVTTAPKDAPWHAWPVVACGGMSIGQRGMIYASKTLAATMVDLFENPEVVAEIRAEFEEKAPVYKGYIPDGPPPLPGK